jgi:hypothetical protein
VAGMRVSTGAVGLISAGLGGTAACRRTEPTLGRARPVTWFGLVFEEVELGDRHGRSFWTMQSTLSRCSARSMPLVTSRKASIGEGTCR